LGNNIFNKLNGNGQGHGAEDKGTKRILVAVKGDDIDDEAMRLAFAYALAKKGKGRSTGVDIVYVVQVPHSLPLDAELTEQVERGEKALDHAETVARDLGIDVDASILQTRDAGLGAVELGGPAGAEHTGGAVRRAGER